MKNNQRPLFRGALETSEIVRDLQVAKSVIEDLRPGQFERMWIEAESLSNGEEEFLEFCSSIRREVEFG